MHFVHGLSSVKAEGGNERAPRGTDSTDSNGSLRKMGSCGTRPTITSPLTFDTTVPATKVSQTERSFYSVASDFNRSSWEMSWSWQIVGAANQVDCQLPS